MPEATYQAIVETAAGAGVRDRPPRPHAATSPGVTAPLASGGEWSCSRQCRVAAARGSGDASACSWPGRMRSPSHWPGLARGRRTLPSLGPRWVLDAAVGDVRLPVEATTRRAAQATPQATGMR